MKGYMRMDRKRLGRWVGWIGAALLLAGCAVTGSKARVCSAGDAYVGAPKVEAPDSLWGLPVLVDFQNELDSGLSSALDRVFVCVLFNDKQYAAEAGLWSLVRTLRQVRSIGPPRTNP